MTLSKTIDFQDVPDLVGLLPAGGRATRIRPIPCSKEVFPIGFQKTAIASEPRVKTVSEYLLEQMHLAGVRKAYVVLRKGKWDIPYHLGDGDSFGMDLAYLIMGRPLGVPFTLDQAFAFIETATVVFGFPDILTWPEDAYAILLDHLRTTGADIVLGLYPAEDPSKVDMVDIDSEGQPREIIIKPDRSSLRLAWINAVWTSTFTRFLHDFTAGFEENGSNRRNLSTEHDTLPERHLGHVIQSAIESGLNLSSVTFDQGRFIDIGTPSDLFRGAATCNTP
jgi:glucose-1-phosphate thymidylyltransferase